MSLPAQLTLPAQYGSRDGHLTIDGLDALQLAAEHGSPLFVFSQQTLAANARNFLASVRSGHEKAAVFFASKACSNLNVLQVIRAEGLGVEVNSGGELYKALSGGFAPQSILFNGVAKTRAELEQAIHHDIKAINVDSTFELQRIADLARQSGRKASVALRLVPGIGGGATAGIQTGSDNTKFGMTLPELQVALEIVRTHAAHLLVKGIHVHIGSQVAGLGDFEQAVAFTARMQREIAAITGQALSHVNLGGGYPINYVHQRPGANAALSPELETYRAAQTAPSMAGHVAQLAAREIGTQTELLFEPGRSLVADAAVLLTRVESQRFRGSQPWLYLDAGYNLLLDSMAGNWYFQMLNASKLDETETAAFRMVGPLCDSTDCFFDVKGEYLWKKLSKKLADLPAERLAELKADIIGVPETRELAASSAAGDLIAILDTGAYTLEEMFQYCGRARAKAIMVGLSGEIITLREADQFEDLLNPAEHKVVQAG